MPSDPHTSAGDDPGLDRMRRLHPFTLVQRFLISAPALFLVLLPALRNPNAGSWVTVGMLFLYAVFVVPIFVTQYLRFRYAVTSDEIVIHKGVFTYQHRNIPFDRIQNIEIEQSPIPRLFGTARVKIETAGSRSTEGVIEFVDLAEARRIRSTVRARQRARTADPGVPASPPGAAEAEHSTAHGVAGGAAGAPASPEMDTDRPESGEHEELLHVMSLGRVLLSGVFRFSLFYIVAIFSAIEYLGVQPEDVTRWFGGDRLEAVADLLERSPLVVVVTTAATVSLLAWLTGIATNLNRFYGFRLALEDQKLHTRHGLLTVSEGTIPLKKVQALLIRTNPLMSLFGWHRLELQTMGFDPNDRGYRVAAPFARREDVLRLARVIRPVESPGRLNAVSRLMIRRTFVRYSVALSVAAGGVGAFWDPALWGFAALPILLVLAVQQYRHHGYRVTDEYLYVRRGVFRESFWILPVDRFQVFYLTQSLLQRRLGLRSLYVDTAGAGVMMHPVVMDLDAEEADQVLESLHAHFVTHFQGRAGNPATSSASSTIG
jgi:putative membrane protein